MNRIVAAKFKNLLSGLDQKLQFGDNEVCPDPRGQRAQTEMGEVVTVPKWGQMTNKANVFLKFRSCDLFIRSKIIAPPVGSAVFNFAGGKVTLTGNVTHICGGDCEITINGDHVSIIGSDDDAVAMFCSIHREIEQIAGMSPFPDTSARKVVVHRLKDGEVACAEDDSLRGLIG